MAERCTRCFGPRDRQPLSFVEEFSDSAWCSKCYEEYVVGSEQMREAIEAATVTVPQRQAG